MNEIRPMNAACPILFAAILAFVTCASAKDVEIRVEGAKTRQLYEGFGATTLSLVHIGPARRYSWP